MRRGLYSPLEIIREATSLSPYVLEVGGKEDPT